MGHFLIALITTLVLVSADILLRGDVIKDDVANYSVITILLLGLIYFSRLSLAIFKNKKISYVLAVLFVLMFSVIYWIQSTVYTVYFQFITAVDIGLVLENLNYWQKGADKLISIINLPWLIGYLLIFTFAFCYRQNFIFDFNINPVRITTFLITVISISSICSLVYIRNQHLYFLTTPMISLTYELRRFNIEKSRFMKPIQAGAEQNYYARNVDEIPSFKRRGDFNVLFVILESLRQDHMSLYGYERDTTPYQKERFKDAFHFPQAISNTTSTDTSAELIFTGIDHTNDDIHSTSALWSYLKKADLNLFYIGSHWLEWNGRFGRAFLSEDVDSIQAPLAVDASLTGYDMITARKFRTTLTEFKNKEKPFFGVVHFAGTHYPYVSPPEYQKWKPANSKFEPSKVKELINKYDNSILYNDAAMEIVISELDELDLNDNTIIIVTADHAEAMYEHQQFFHGKVFWQEGIHVPLYIDIPNQLREQFSVSELYTLNTNADNFISILDLFPTILDIYNIPQAKKLDGFSLLKPYPETHLKVYMIPEEYAIIHSKTGIKTHVDNGRRIVRRTDLRVDPNERNYIEQRTNRFIPIQEMLQVVEEKKLAEITNSINNE